MRHTLTRLRATVRSHIAVRITASRGISTLSRALRMVSPGRKVWAQIQLVSIL